MLGRWLLPHHEIENKWEKVSANGEPISALALGDSTGVSLQFDQIGQEGISLCSPSIAVEMELTRARIALHKFPTIRTVYYQLTAGTLQNRYSSERNYFEDLPLDWAALKVAPFITIRSIFNSFRANLLWRQQWNAYDATLWTRVQKVYLGEVQEGLATWAEMESEFFKWKKGRAQDPQDMDREARRNRDLLADFADELDQRDIELVIVLAPESPVILSNWPELYPPVSHLRSLVSHSNVRLIDLAQLCNDLPVEAPNLYFRDFIHLNPVGAAKYNAALKRHLNLSE